MPQGMQTDANCFGSVQSIILMPDSKVQEMARMADVRDYDLPGGSSVLNRAQRGIRFFFFKYLVAPFFRTTWQRQVDFNRRVATLAQTFSAMEARIHELEEKLAGADSKL